MSVAVTGTVTVSVTVYGRDDAAANDTSATIEHEDLPREKKSWLDVSLLHDRGIWSITTAVLLGGHF